MWYQQQHTPVLSPQEWYNLLETHYRTYHKQLTERDKPTVLQYLPRSLKDKRVLDLWGGDGRRAMLLRDKQVTSRTIVDNAENLLNHAPRRTEKIVADLEHPLPPTVVWPYDLILCLFVCIHLQEIEPICIEASKLISPDGRMLLLHHHERRTYIHEMPDQTFKIQTKHRRRDDIEEALSWAGWVYDTIDIDEYTKLYSCFPKKL